MKRVTKLVAYDSELVVGDDNDLDDVNADVVAAVVTNESIACCSSRRPRESKLRSLACGC
jgi:hypothetical protein